MSSIYSSCPVRFEKLQLSERVTSLVTRQTSFNYFSLEVGWLLESSTQIIFKYKDKIIKEGTTFNDYYGFLTSINEAADEAKKIAESYSLDENSELDICLITSITRSPVQYSDSPEGIKWNKEDGKKKMYEPLFENSYIFLFDKDKEEQYLEKINSVNPEDVNFEAWDIISPLHVKRQTVIEDFDIGSFKNGFDHKLEEFNESIGKWM